MTEVSRGRGSGGQFVYDELKRRILELELKPGERVYEPALAAELEVSRTPLREGMRRLLSENLLEQQPTGGVVVPRLDEKQIAELYDVRASLEALMARTACELATPADLEAISGLIDRNAALVTFADDAMHAGKAIHARIGAVAANSVATRLHDQVATQMARYRMFTNHTQERRDQALAEHRGIYEAIASGNPRVAADAAWDHVLSARDEAVRAMGGKLLT